MSAMRSPTALPIGRIVHVSADFPDSCEPGKTRAIESLVRMVDDRLDNHVFSLNRTGSIPGFARRALEHRFRPQLDIRTSDDAGALTAVRYDAPPHGIWHATLLDQLGEWLAERLAREARPALLVGHKLTVEGIIVRRAAMLLGVPYALSIQGDTDTKILAARPDLRPLLSRCFHEASMVFPFAPWALRRIETVLGTRAAPSIVLPCPVANDKLMTPRAGGDGLVSAFHLQSRKRKNLKLMAAASDLLVKAVPGSGLTIIGGGASEDHAACARIAARHPAVSFEGPKQLAEMPGRFNRASGFVLASRRESFGLVFIEALLAGLPIAYPAGWGVDGFFDHQPFAVPVDNRSAESIADGMARLLRDEASLKQSLAEWQSGPGPARFQRAAIAERFAAGIIVAAGMPAKTS